MSTQALPTRADGVRGLALRVVLGAALITSVALCNRFPLTSYDSASYLKKAYAFTHAAHPLSLHIEDYLAFLSPGTSPLANPFFYQPAPYTVFLVPFADPMTLQGLPFVQGLLAAFVVVLTLRTAGVNLSIRGYAVFFAALTFCTSLPWLTGQVVPDLFTGLLVLLTYVTLWGEGRLSEQERTAAAVLLVLALATHLSHLPLFLGLLVAGLLWQAMMERVAIDLPDVVHRALLPLVVAVAVLVGCNYVFTRRVVLSESSSLLYLARLVGDGTAQRYLNRACTEHGYLLCDERGNLPESSDYFLWASAGAWSRHQGDPRFLAEAGQIVRGTLRQEWPAQLAASLRHAAAQLGSIGPDAELHQSDGEVRPLLALFGAPTLNAYQTSLQARGELPLGTAGTVQVWAVTVSLVLLLVAARWGVGAYGRAAGLVWITLCGVLLNAVLVGALSVVHGSNESRVSWLVPLAGLVVVARWLPVLRAARPAVPSSVSAGWQDA